MKRRQFISKVATMGIGAFVAGSGLSFADIPARPRLPRRRYGHTDIRLSIIGFGGIVVSGIEQSEANDTVAWAVDRGVNYFDVAPTYGNAQERLGPALEPYRDNCFLACKTTQRDVAKSQEELDESLRLLRTDHVDLYQLHGIRTLEEVDTIFAAGGAMETFVKAREDGKALHLGFSAHSTEAALKAMDLFDFDSVLFPFNVVCWENGGFGPEVLKVARKKGVARLALKAMAWRPWGDGEKRIYSKCWYRPIDDPELARLAISYALDKPITAMIPPGEASLFKLAVELGLRYEPLSDDERTRLLAQFSEATPIFHA